MKNLKKIIFLFVLLFSGRCVPDFSSKFSLIQIDQGNEKLFIKKETWGLHEAVWSISHDGDPCHGPNDESDYVFPSTPVDFALGRQEGNFVILTRNPPRPPQKNPWNYPLEIRIVHPLDWEKIQRDLRGKGFVFINENSGPFVKCGE